jgi:hypothetical protein
LEIKNAASKVKKCMKRGRQCTHAHVTLQTFTAHVLQTFTGAGGSSSRLGPAAAAHTGSRRQQRACHETRAPDRDGPDRTGWFTGSLKNRPVQPVFSGLIA